MRNLAATISFLAALAIAIPALANPERWRASGWATDFSQTEVDLGEIISGGPGRDGIPAIDAPVFRKASTLEHMGASEPVIRLEVGSVVRAYPLRVLTWHEIVNDTLDGQPVAVTYCPLCNSSIVFDRRLEDGSVTTFGVSGLLRNSDMVMYDRATESWWQQFTGEAIVGERAGQALRMLPSRIQGFGEFARENPDAEVLVPADPALRRYGENPYVGYDSRQAPYPLYTGELPEELPAMMRVVIARHAGELAAVTLPHLKAVDSLEINGLRLTWRGGVASALDARDIAAGADVGTVTAERLSDGAAIVHDTTFAFVVLAFHPGLTVHAESGPITLSSR
ncbi:DUF3179 domain-containing protein [Pseudohoeflea coraliihabitans]|uniref:DUF3179 domain-containing protein n=1 Tax=Pseudohoeflea coraliihabitans TaxID=2860393 RepID=A0ABS6WK65_9HYPH|nr:DUF3179 domain-containing protein [Pseudohoeflea sp. DP4N28-3]MBW3096339.1 DUF3179 domain-containing protein [Pseudohoeflea sp. DP4N28-3]